MNWVLRIPGPMDASGSGCYLTPLLRVVALVVGLGSAKMPSWGGGILRVWSLQDPEEEGTSEVDAHSTRNVRVEAGGTQVPGHVGFHALGVVR